MKYYGIVSEIKKEHKTGVYGRKKLTMKDYEDLLKDSLKFDWGDSFIILTSIIFPVSRLFSLLHFMKKGVQIINKTKPITLIPKIKVKSRYKILILPNELLNNNYILDNEFSYGLLDEFSFIGKVSAFKIIMQSKGGSSLNIVEIKNMPPKLKHFGGENGRFNEGLYVAHPKDENLLLPLKNFNNLIQTLILEETIRAYEALGAKEILIEDVTTTKADLNGKYKAVKTEVEGEYKKEVLRLKKFGKGTFDTKRALNDKLFIHDIPAVMSTIDARINGNQILEEFTETINIKIGIDVAVLELFESNNNFSYQRKWHFKVEFYDKNELNNA